MAQSTDQNPSEKMRRGYFHGAERTENLLEGTGSFVRVVFVLQIDIAVRVHDLGPGAGKEDTEELQRVCRLSLGQRGDKPNGFAKEQIGAKHVRVAPFREVCQHEWYP